MIKKQDGQSTIEFILTFTFGMSAILLIFNSAINYTVGYLTHYATFMASRTFLTVDSDSNDPMQSISEAQSRAQSTFARFNLNKFGVPNSALKFNPPQSSMSSSDYLMVGAYAVYDREIDIMGKLTGNTKATMVSESFLGREVSRGECIRRVCFAMTGGTSCAGVDVTLIDDGC